MRKRLLILPNGMRSVSEGNLFITTNNDDNYQEVDLTGATQQEFDKIRQNPHDDRLIQTVKNNIHFRRGNK